MTTAVLKAAPPVLVALALALLALGYCSTPQRQNRGKRPPAAARARKEKARPVRALRVRVVSLPKRKAPSPVAAKAQRARPRPERANRPKRVASPRPSQGKGRPARRSGSAQGYGLTGRFDDCPVAFYVDKVHARGGMTVVFDRKNERMFELTPSGGLRPLAAVPRGLSAVARRLTADYPGAGRVLSRARALFGSGRYEIALLWPADLASRVAAMVEAAAAEAGVPADQILSALLTYRRRGGDLVIELSELRTTTGVHHVRGHRIVL